MLHASVIDSALSIVSKDNTEIPPILILLLSLTPTHLNPVPLYAPISLIPVVLPPIDSDPQMFHTKLKLVFETREAFVNKLSHFHSFLSVSDYHICAITESWLTTSIFDKEVVPPAYTLFCKDRSLGRGGGVFLAVRNTVPCTLLPSSPSLEVVSILISRSTSVSIVYVPPTYYVHSLLEHLSSVISKSVCSIIFGDFNCPSINWNQLNAGNDVSNSICDFVYRYSL